MKSLHLLLALPARPDQIVEFARQAAPTLIKLLKRGQTVPHQPSLAGTLCHACAIDQQQDWPLASICAAADGLPKAAKGYWLRLDPVHLEVVMGGLILRPPVSLQLTQPEAAALISAINQHWHHDALYIQSVNPTRWYLRLREAPNLRTTPLDQMGGEYLTPHLPRGADARQYMQRINEVQMLLHSHPVNLARESAGQATVNGLWLWGGGSLPEASKQFDLIAADAFELQSLAFHTGALFSPQPTSLSKLERCNRALVALTQSETDWDGNLAARLTQLEQDWFQPLLQQLNLGRIHQVRLDLIGHQAASLTPAQSWRIWR